MVDAESVQRRLRRLDEQVQQLRMLGDLSREEFLSDNLKQAAAARLLQTSIQVVLDIGSHILAERGVVDWEEYRQIPQRLAQLEVISRSLSERLKKAAGVRNILVHMYLDVDAGMLYDTIHHELDAFGEFAECVLLELGD